MYFRPLSYLLFHFVDGIPMTWISLMYKGSSVPSKPKKTGTFGIFLDASRQQFWKLALAKLDAISFTGENFTKQIFFIL